MTPFTTHITPPPSHTLHLHPHPFPFYSRLHQAPSHPVMNPSSKQVRTAELAAKMQPICGSILPRWSYHPPSSPYMTCDYSLQLLISKRLFTPRRSQQPRHASHPLPNLPLPGLFRALHHLSPPKKNRSIHLWRLLLMLSKKVALKRSHRTLNNHINQRSTNRNQPPQIIQNQLLLQIQLLQTRTLQSHLTLPHLSLASSSRCPHPRCIATAGCCSAAASVNKVHHLV